MRVVHRNEKGVVSLFLVIFSALLITIITVAFIRIMVQEQQQATANDLSKSALESAQAGVEDAKRAIVTYRTQCKDSTTPECIQLRDALTNTSHPCDTLEKSGLYGVDEENDEVLIKRPDDGTLSDNSDRLLSQAYTCVKIYLDTLDYVGSISSNSSRLIPLVSDEPFDRITVYWYSQQDILEVSDESGSVVTTVDLPSDTKLSRDWPENRPAIIRAQLLQFGDSFRLSDFDRFENNSTLFLYPSSLGLNTMSFADDFRRSPNSRALRDVHCDPNFSATSANNLFGQYACAATIELPNPINAADPSQRKTAYLRLNQIYKSNTHFKVVLEYGSSREVREFKEVQPKVDSTGRANDLFRRVESRIDLEGSTIPNIEAAVDITGNLCKAFIVTDKESEYDDGGCQEN